MKYVDKIYLSQDKLIEKLKSDGLIINNIQYTKKYLDQVGYYKLINGYKHCFKIYENKIETSNYMEETKFEHIVSLYSFDFKLKHLILKNICIIENILKSQISENFSKLYGTNHKKYLVEENFVNYNLSAEKHSFKELNEEINKKINSSLSHKNKSIQQYNYKGYYPLWVIMNIISFGTACIFFKKLKNEIQIEIGKYFDLSFETMHSYLSHLVFFRNACAHNEVIFNLRTENRLKHKDKKSIDIYEQLEIKKNEYNTYSNGINNLLSIFIVFKQMLPKNIFSDFKKKFFKLLLELENNVNKQAFVNIKRNMGIYTKEELLKKV